MEDMQLTIGGASRNKTQSLPLRTEETTVRGRVALKEWERHQEWEERLSAIGRDSTLACSALGFFSSWLRVWHTVGA